MNIPNPIQSFHGSFQPPATVSWADYEAALKETSRRKLEEITRLKKELEAAMARLKQLEWVPVTERMPELDDADEFEDVEWSDGKDIWQGNYRNEDNATHWRRITLP